MERGVSKRELLNQLGQSSHASLQDYIPLCVPAARDEAEFYAHLITWNHNKGAVRDVQMALPVIGLNEFTEPEFIGNALAHLAKLTPRELLAAYKFAQGYVRNKGVEMRPHPKTGKPVKMRLGGWKRFTSGKSFLGPASRRRALDNLVTRYLRKREDNSAEFERNLVQFRRSLISLYGLSHTQMSAYARTLIMDKTRPQDTAMDAIKRLETMTPIQAAASIVEHRIPFLMLFPVLKDKAKDPLLLMAIIDRMSPSELQTNIKMLERMGVKDHPETRVALENGLKRMATSTSRKTALKTAKAAELVEDQALKSKLKEVQEKQIDRLKGIDGNWLILADASGSMQEAVATGVMVAGTLARFVKERIGLVFFDASPRYFDVTGQTLEEIKYLTRHVTAGGYTSIGCGLQAAMERKQEIDGIIVISDGWENANPRFVQQYQRLLAQSGKDVPVYYFHLGHGGDTFLASMNAAGYAMQVTELNGMTVDDYSIPNIVQSLRVNRYSVIDEVLESKLWTVDEVLGIEKEELIACN